VLFVNLLDKRLVSAIDLAVGWVAAISETQHPSPAHHPNSLIFLNTTDIASFIDLYRSAIVTDVEEVTYQVRGMKSAVLLISTVSPDC